LRFPGCPRILFIVISNTASISLSGVSHFSNAAESYDVAGDQNYADAQFAYALCLENGSGVSLNVIEATNYYILVADQHHGDAQFNYGLCLATGSGSVT
jgi:TPR repeat protein